MLIAICILVMDFARQFLWGFRLWTDGVAPDASR
jgi:hypothetical protein